MHTAQAHEEASQASKMEPFAKWLIFVKNSISLANDYMAESFSPGWNFNSLYRDYISSRILSDNNVKIELRLYEKV